MLVITGSKRVVFFLKRSLLNWLKPVLSREPESNEVFIRIGDFFGDGEAGE